MTPHLNCDTSGRQCILPPSNAGAADFLQVLSHIVPMCSDFVHRVGATCWYNVVQQLALRFVAQRCFCVHGARHCTVPLRIRPCHRNSFEAPQIGHTCPQPWPGETHHVPSRASVASSVVRERETGINWHKLAINWTFTCNQQPVWCQICGMGLETKSLGSEHGSGTLLEGGAHDANESYWYKYYLYQLIMRETRRTDE